MIQGHTLFPSEKLVRGAYVNIYLSRNYYLTSYPYKTRTEADADLRNTATPCIYRINVKLKHEARFAT